MSITKKASHLTEDLQLLAAGTLVLAAVVPLLSHRVRLVLDDAAFLRPDCRLVRLLVAAALAVRVAAEALLAHADGLGFLAPEYLVSAFGVWPALEKIY